LHQARTLECMRLVHSSHTAMLQAEHVRVAGLQHTSHVTTCGTWQITHVWMNDTPSKAGINALPAAHTVSTQEERERTSWVAELHRTPCASSTASIAPSTNPCGRVLLLLLLLLLLHFCSASWLVLVLVLVGLAGPGGTSVLCAPPSSSSSPHSSSAKSRPALGCSSPW